MHEFFVFKQLAKMNVIMNNPNEYLKSILLQNPLSLPKNEMSEVRCHMAYKRAGRVQGRRFIIDFNCFPKRVFFAQKGGVLQQNLIITFPFYFHHSLPIMKSVLSDFINISNIPFGNRQTLPTKVGG